MIKALLFFVAVIAIGGTMLIVEAARIGYDRGIEEGIRRLGDVLLDELENMRENDAERNG